MTSIALPKQRAFGETTRKDVWWLYPLAVFLGFSAFIVYSTFAALQGTNPNVCHYWFGGGGANYLSPFYSPTLFGAYSHPGIFGTVPPWWPALLPFSPAFFIMWVPAGFRFTCYYYRGAYYKAFWLDPVACAVGEPRKTYLGERYMPLILQNVHRYFMYLAVIFIFILGRDAWDSLWFGPEGGPKQFGVAVGSVVLILNVILLSGYTLGCHSLRHLVGGFLDAPSKHKACEGCYHAVSCLNRKHQLWAWLSLFWVGFTDLYIRLCAMGVWHDYHVFTL